MACVLFGNQCDRMTEKVVSTQEGREMASHFDMDFFEGSAKRDENIKEAFGCLVSKVKRVLEADRSPMRASNAPARNDAGTIDLSDGAAQKKNSGSRKACC